MSCFGDGDGVASDGTDGAVGADSGDGGDGGNGGYVAYGGYVVMVVMLVVMLVVMVVMLVVMLVQAQVVTRTNEGPNLVPPNPWGATNNSIWPSRLTSAALSEEIFFW